MDWKTIGNYVLLVGLFVAMVTMFNQVNGRIDSLQVETNRRFDVMQAESNRRFDEMNRRFDRVDQRFDAMQAENQRQHDAMQAENQRQHDAMQEVLRVFEGRTYAPRRKSRYWPRKRRIVGCLAPAYWGPVPRACDWFRAASAAARAWSG